MSTSCHNLEQNCEEKSDFNLRKTAWQVLVKIRTKAKTERTRHESNKCTALMGNNGATSATLFYYKVRMPFICKVAFVGKSK